MMSDAWETCAGTPDNSSWDSRSEKAVAAEGISASVRDHPLRDLKRRTSRAVPAARPARVTPSGRSRRIADGPSATKPSHASSEPLSHGAQGTYEAPVGGRATKRVSCPAAPRGRAATAASARTVMYAILGVACTWAGRGSASHRPGGPRISVGPVLELGALVAGPDLVLHGQRLQGVADRQRDRVAGSLLRENARAGP